MAHRLSPSGGVPKHQLYAVVRETMPPVPRKACRSTVQLTESKDKRWRQNARARGIVIEHLKHRRLTDKPRGKRDHMFTEHWAEMVACLEAQPDQTALELLAEFQARYPDRYHLRNLSALYRRVRVWRGEATQRLIYDINGDIANVSAAVDRRS